MGAWFDDRLGYGRNVTEAFRRAADQAAWEHGHGGYTGTIAEKSDYVTVPLPPRATATKVLDLAAKLADSSSIEYLREEVADHDRYGQGARKTLGGKTLKQAQAELAKAERAHARLVAKIPANLRSAVETTAQAAYGDKWGPAVAFELSGTEAKLAKAHLGVNGRRGVKVYRFAGMCSS